MLRFLSEHVKDAEFPGPVPLANSTPWRSGTTAARSISAVWDYFPDTRSGFGVTVAGDKPF